MCSSDLREADAIFAGPRCRRIAGELDEALIRRRSAGKAQKINDGLPRQSHLFGAIVKRADDVERSPASEDARVIGRGEVDTLQAEGGNIDQLVVHARQHVVGARNVRIGPAGQISAEQAGGGIIALVGLCLAPNGVDDVVQLDIEPVHGDRQPRCKIRGEGNTIGQRRRTFRREIGITPDNPANRLLPGDGRRLLPRRGKFFFQAGQMRLALFVPGADRNDGQPG